MDVWGNVSSNVGSNVSRLTTQPPSGHKSQSDSLPPSSSSSLLFIIELMKIYKPRGFSCVHRLFFLTCGQYVANPAWNYILFEMKNRKRFSSSLNVCAIKLYGFIDKYWLTDGSPLLYFTAVKRHYTAFHQCCRKSWCISIGGTTPCKALC